MTALRAELHDMATRRVPDAALERMRSNVMAQLRREGLLASASSVAAETENAGSMPVEARVVEASVDGQEYVASSTAGGLWGGLVAAWREWWAQPLGGLPAPAWAMAVVVALVAVGVWTTFPRGEAPLAPVGTSGVATTTPPTVGNGQEALAEAVSVDVLLKRGQWEMDEPMEAGRPGEVSTGTDGYVALALGKRARVIALPAGRLAVERSDAKHSHFRLFKGSALFEARLSDAEKAQAEQLAANAESTDAPYVVSTAHAVLRVSGTRFIVQTDEAVTRVTVESGVVWATPRPGAGGGKAVRVGAGEVMEFPSTAGGSLRPRPYPVNDPHGLLLARVAAALPFDDPEQPAIALGRFLDEMAPPTVAAVKEPARPAVGRAAAVRGTDSAKGARMGATAKAPGSFPAAGDPTDANFDIKLDAVKRLMLAKDHTGAIEACKAMRARWPQHPRLGEVLYRQSQAEILAGRSEEARATLEQMITRDDREITEDAYFHLGRLDRTTLRNFPRAFTTYGQYLQRFPESPRANEARMARCEIADHAGASSQQADICGDLLKRLPADHPWRPTVRYLRGVGLHIGQKNPAAGLAEYDEALKTMEPTDFNRDELRFNRAMALMELGRVEEGRAEIRELLVKHPNHPKRAQLEAILHR